MTLALPRPWPSMGLKRIHAPASLFVLPTASSRLLALDSRSISSAHVLDVPPLGTSLPRSSKLDVTKFTWSSLSNRACRYAESSSIGLAHSPPLVRLVSSSTHAWSMRPLSVRPPSVRPPSGLQLSTTKESSSETASELFAVGCSQP